MPNGKFDMATAAMLNLATKLYVADKHLGDLSCLRTHWLIGSEKHPNVVLQTGHSGYVLHQQGFKENTRTLTSRSSRKKSFRSVNS